MAITSTSTQNSWNPTSIQVDGINVIPFASRTAIAGGQYLYSFISNGNTLISNIQAPGYTSVTGKQP